MNPNPKGQGGATADFGNCNSLILRCAQPKCAGCTSMELAIPIVNGCVQSNPACKQYGDDLVQSMAAQLVSSANSKANDAQAAAAQAAAAQSAAQSSAVMEQMQMQMQQMQMEMQQQSAQSAMAVQQALEEQKQLAAEQAAQAAAAQAAAAAATQAAAPAQVIQTAAAAGVSADVLAREQIGGKILTQIENAEVALKEMKNTMQNVFAYARCDANGNNCQGPRRVKAFKAKANNFFDPYERVLDEIYDALILAQSLGVDISDIYMMLNGSCNVWGKYMCQPCDGPTYDKDNKLINSGAYVSGNVIHECTSNTRSDSTNVSGYFYDVAKVCEEGKNCKVSPVQHRCTLLQMLTNNEEIQQNWLDMDAGSSGGIRVACASDALENSTLFRNRKKQASIDIETLQQIINQDTPNIFRSLEDAQAALKYCSIADEDIATLQVLTQKKTLTATGGDWRKVCVADKDLKPRGIVGAITITPSSCEAGVIATFEERIIGCTGEAKDLCIQQYQHQKDSKIAQCKADQAAADAKCIGTSGRLENGKCICPDTPPLYMRFVYGRGCVGGAEYNDIFQNTYTPPAQFVPQPWLPTTDVDKPSGGVSNTANTNTANKNTNVKPPATLTFEQMQQKSKCPGAGGQWNETGKMCDCSKAANFMTCLQKLK